MELKMKKLSVIVPIYNTENYLRECLDSLVQQTYSNVEIILVDDGSTDGSFAICKEYESRFDNIILFHKENGGGGSARNLALDYVTGDYVTFVDSDDWIIDKACETIMSLIEEYGADIVHCEVFKEIDKRNQNENHTPSILNKKETFELMLNDRLRSGALKIFKRELINDIRFPLDSSIDDMVFFSNLIERVNSMVISDVEVYYYRYNREDNMSNTSTRFVRNVFERYVEFLKRYEIAVRNNVDGQEAYKKAIEHALVFYAHDEVADEWNEQRKQIEEYIRLNIRTIRANNLISKRDKFKCNLLAINPSVYMRISKMFRKKGTA
jgi:glycosyltransferase involved in cell wall biosynthesis